MGVSNDNDEARIQVLDDRKGNCGEVQVPKLCNGDCLEYKYQIAMETVEWNTSKQVSAKETALQNVYDYSRINFFFFLKWNECGEQSQGNGMEVI